VRAALLRIVLSTSLLTTLTMASVGVAEMRSEMLLPATSKGFVAVPDVYQLQDSFEQTQLGRLSRDPSMQPFIEEVREQLDSRFSQTREKLGLSLEDLEDVPGGELGFALIQPGGKEDQAAVALVVDVTGHREQATALLAKIDNNLKRQGATKTEQSVGAVTLRIYTLPKKRGATSPRQAVFFLHDDVLGACDNESEAKDMVRRLLGEKKDSLATVPALTAVLQRAGQSVSDLAHELRWFVEPFGFVEARRAADADWTRKRGKDMLRILEQQGFDAIQGVGGYVNFYVEGRYEMLHRTAVFAPPVSGAPAGEKYTLAARMLKFPNEGPLSPHQWLPRELAMFASLNIATEKAFNASETLVDAIVGQKGIFKDIIRSLREDPNGPQIDLRSDLVQHLGGRVTVVSDNHLPITTKSERTIVAIETNDAEVVAATVAKTMRTDPEARRREFNGHVVWEIVEQEVEVEKLEVIEPLNPLEAEAEADDDEPRKLPNSAVCVAHGHLLIATHFDFLTKVLADHRETLAESLDYQFVQQELDQLMAHEPCLRAFSRTDETYRGTYELIRTGKMPEAESMLGRLLNALLGSGKKGEIRRQRIDGDKLPDFERVRRYFGPTGMLVTSEENGWFAIGLSVSKEVRVAEASK